MKSLINANALRDKVTTAWTQGEINTEDMHKVMELIDDCAAEDEGTESDDEALPFC